VKVSEVRSLSLSQRPCSASSVVSGKTCIIDDNATCPLDDTPCHLESTDNVLLSKASLSDVVDNKLSVDDGDDNEQRHSVAADSSFPIKPPQHAAAASCPPSPPSPPSDVVRTSAEGRTFDEDEADKQPQESDDNMTS